VSTAIGMVELNSISRGIDVCDSMVKAAQVELLRGSTVCPGKYFVLVSGDTGSVRASVAEGVKCGGDRVVDTLLLPNVHPQLASSLGRGKRPVPQGAIGVLEFYSVSSAIVAADLAVKAAEVTLIDVRLGGAIGGKGYVTLCGDVGAVRAAVAAASRDKAMLDGATVIPKPSQEVYRSLL